MGKFLFLQQTSIAISRKRQEKHREMIQIHEFYLDCSIEAEQEMLLRV